MVQELYNRLIGIQQVQEEMRNESVWVQAVAEVIGKSVGIDLPAFVKERERIIHANKMIGNTVEESI
jgi:pyruvate formate-lyase activating enzyme-like uncharacterized protein